MAYLGNSPGVSSQRVATTFTATAGQTAFNPVGGYTLGYADVFLNGVKLIDGTDFTAADGVTITLVAGAALNDNLETLCYTPHGLSDGYTKPEADARYQATSNGSIDVTGTVTAAAGIFTTADINAGTIDGTTIGATTPASVAATTLSTTGAATFGGSVNAGAISSFAGGLYVNATDQLWLDSGGDSYLQEVSSNIIRVVAASNEVVRFDGNTLGATFSGNVTADGLTVQTTNGLNAVLESTTSYQYLQFKNSGYTENYIDFTNRDFHVLCDNVNRFTINGTTGAATFSGDVGIGGAPLANNQLLLTDAGTYSQFHMQNSTSGSGASDGFRILMDGVNTTITNHETGYMAFETQNTERLRIDASGKILIGDSASQTADLLQIETPASGGGTGIQIRRADSNTDQGVGRIQFGNNTATDLASISAKTDGATDNGALLFNTSVSGGANTERMRIDSSGNVGIGRTDPTQLLEVHKNSGGDQTVAKFSAHNYSDTGKTYIELGTEYEDGSSRIGSFNDTGNKSVLVFETHGASSGAFDERMRIDSIGNLLVAKTTAGTVLTHGVELSSAGGVFSTTSDAGNSSYFVNLAATGTRYLQRFYASTTFVGSITSTGTATAYNTTSDYRLKEDDVPMTGATERVKALRPVNFAWKVDGSRTDGFFAHELAEVVPEAATGTKDAMRDEEYEVTPAVEEVRDEDGNVTTEAVAAVMGTRSVPDYQGIDQSKLVPLLTAALQEAIAKIEALTARIEALEGA